MKPRASTHRRSFSVAALLACVVAAAGDVHVFAPPHARVLDEVLGGFHPGAVFAAAATERPRWGKSAYVVAGDVGDHGQSRATAGASFDKGVALENDRGEAFARLRLLDAVGSRAETVRNTVAYANVRPGVDAAVVGIRNGADLVLVVEHPSDMKAMHFALDGERGAALRLQPEPSTGAVLATNGRGRAVARLSAPLAIDAKGKRVQGTLSVSGGDVEARIDARGLAFPIVIDPTFTEPFWTVADDARSPSARLYNGDTLSREAHTAVDTLRQRIVAVRPTRSLQTSDAVAVLGDATHDSPTFFASLQSSGAQTTGAAYDPTTTADLARTLSTGSETWAWDGTSWSMNPTATLPGLIDPALSYDSDRDKVVLFGGIVPNIQCDNVLETLASNRIFCSTNQALDQGTYEYDGTSWQGRVIPGGPSPRVGAAMTYDSVRHLTVLFGGRILDPANYTLSNILPFPENVLTDFSAETWIYDGSRWTLAPTSHAPPAVEAAAIAFDPVRGRVVLVGGHRADDATGASDRFSLWEFDGQDWTERFDVADAALPASLATRRGAGVFWNPLRQRINIVGGHVDHTEECSLAPAMLASQRAAAATNTTLRNSLAQSQCWPSYAQDLWEWDGTTLTRTVDVGFRGSYVGSEAVLQELTSCTPWSAAATVTPAGATTTPTSLLLPWAFDPRPQHYQPRTHLEKAYYTPPGPSETVGHTGVASALSTDDGTRATTSPAYVPTSRPELGFVSALGKVELLDPDTGRAFALDACTATEVTPTGTPFSSSANDFLAVAWDTANDRLVAFDPTTGSTWVDPTGGTWTTVAAAAGGPLAWTLPTSVRTLRDIDPLKGQVKATPDVTLLTQAAQQRPSLVFDRTRGVPVMLYAQALWEFGVVGWTRASALPVAFTSCAASTLVAYDGTHKTTVITGCTIPAQTWTWDGTTLQTFAQTPFQDSFDRYTMQATDEFDANVQLPWTHPNALAESPTLGGVVLVDANATLRLWNGSAWTAGPSPVIPTNIFTSSTFGHEPYSASCVTSGLMLLNSIRSAETYGVRLFTDPTHVVNVIDLGSGAELVGVPDAPYQVPPWTNLTGMLGIPMCFQPPVFEDPVNGMLDVLRDGPVGRRSLRLAPMDTFWRDSNDHLTEYSVATPAPPIAVEPFPQELLSPESVTFSLLNNPVTVAVRPGAAAYSGDVTTGNLWWPYRVLTDPVGKRVRLLTHRGMQWNVGSEPFNDLGAPCNVDSDCNAYGVCSPEGICCAQGNGYGGPCMTCATPNGLYQPLPNGTPDPLGRCGSGDCAGICKSTSPTAAACSYNGTLACGPAVCGTATARAGVCSATSASCVISATTCPGSLACASTGGCKTACATTADCASPLDVCSADGTRCVKAPTCTGGQLSTPTCSAVDPTCTTLPTATVCSGGLGCANAQGCKTACASRLDCLNKYQECSGDGSGCTPDAASVAATSLGAAPTTWVAPALRTPAEVSAILADAGYPTDDTGRFFFPELSNGVVQLGYDPNLATPSTGYQLFMNYLESCVRGSSDHSADACLAGAARCVTNTPWLGDPSGRDCAPEPCIVKYFTLRTTLSPAASVYSLTASGCYPGLAVSIVDAGGAD